MTIGGSGLGNTIDFNGDNGGNGLSIAGSNVSVLGNELDDNGSLANHSGDGIYVAATASAITLGGASGAGNTITDNFGTDLEIMGTDVTVAGNTLGSLLVDGGTGVSLSDNTLNSVRRITA